MFKKNDPNSFTKFFELYNGTKDEAGVVQIGYLIADYSVMHYDDVQVYGTGSVKKPDTRKFMVHCSQRIIITNSDTVLPSKVITAYSNYPAIVKTDLELALPLPAMGTNSIKVLEYSPKTVNTTVQQAGSTVDSDGKTSGTSKSNTVGSSTSQTNSYGVSVSVGAAWSVGEWPSFNGSETGNFEHSSSRSREKSRTSGHESSSSSGHDATSSDSMSIKDWGAYATIEPVHQKPNWIFGQEYPWDAITCRKTDGTANPLNENQEKLLVPEEMLARLYDKKMDSLYPPSQLSLFGINFIMKTVWLTTLDNKAKDEIDIEHGIWFLSASHQVDEDKKVHVYISKKPVKLKCELLPGAIKTRLNLPLVALDVMGAPGKPAIIGFVPNKFTVQPGPITQDSKARIFKIVSAANTLWISDTSNYPDKAPDSGTIGAGFSVTETVLSAAFAPDIKELRMTAYFKVVDTSGDYKLYFKHWKAKATGIKLSLVINEDKDNPIVKYVDAVEAEGGEDNLLTIALRNQNYASVDYHDYLQLGLNSIEVIIEPITGQYSDDCIYQIHAISIEKE